VFPFLFSLLLNQQDMRLLKAEAPIFQDTETRLFHQRQ
jgi:hypothetical protein